MLLSLNQDLVSLQTDASLVSHTIIPAMVTRDNELFMAYGVMGEWYPPAEPAHPG